jgi:hypothetical protein
MVATLGAERRWHPQFFKLAAAMVTFFFINLKRLIGGIFLSVQFDGLREGPMFFQGGALIFLDGSGMTGYSCSLQKDFHHGCG